LYAGPNLVLECGWKRSDRLRLAAKQRTKTLEEAKEAESLHRIVFRRRCDEPLVATAKAGHHMRGDETAIQFSMNLGSS
jgi:hypothetical protein